MPRVNVRHVLGLRHLAGPTYFVVCEDLRIQLPKAKRKNLGGRRRKQRRRILGAYLVLCVEEVVMKLIIPS